jgi:hypothetical protein
MSQSPQGKGGYRQKMALVTFVMGSAGVALVAYGLKSYRDSLTRVPQG